MLLCAPFLLQARLMGLDLAVSAITGVDLDATSLDLDWFKEQVGGLQVDEESSG